VNEVVSVRAERVAAPLIGEDEKDVGALIVSGRRGRDLRPACHKKQDAERAQERLHDARHDSRGGLPARLKEALEARDAIGGQDALFHLNAVVQQVGIGDTKLAPDSPES